MTAKADTICAIATPPGRGGVGVVRISGPDSFSITSQLCGTLPAARRAGLRTLREIDQTTIDQGLVICFPGPASFTGEDVVEVQTHGSPVVLEMILRTLVAAGARRARPGEFSERAFINDRLDLAQAEAIADLINAGSEQAARAASRSLEGVLSHEVEALAEGMIALRVWVEAALDFADEDVDFLADGQVLARARSLLEALDQLHTRARSGRLLNDGIRVAIVGQPNAGKSSLLNALTHRESAIVTDLPGTTRDVLRETIAIGGMPITLADTAGLREATDAVELEGLRRARLEMKHADLLFWVVDVNSPDARLPPGLPEQIPRIRINNKIDLVGKEPAIDGQNVWLSARTGAGLNLLEQAVLEQLKLSTDSQGEFSARQRHVEALANARMHLASGIAEIATTGSGELLAEELKLAAEQLGEITGKISSDELLGRIFSSFCIGK